MPSRDVTTAAYNQAVESLSRSMPLLMHGAGDVLPQNVDGDAAKLVASLTVDYIASLTDAALSVHLHQTDDDGAALKPPPPRFSKSLLPAVPPPFTTSSTPTTASTSMIRDKTSNKRRRRHDDDFWDEPLAQSKIKRQQSSSSPPSDDIEQQQQPPSSEWVGVSGCDFSRHSRARSVYVNSSNALSTHAFLFPICHDPYAYGRVTQIQASKRSLLPLLTDASTMELVKTEGIIITHRRNKKKKLKIVNKPKNKSPEKKKKGKNDEEEDENDEEDDDEDDEDQDNESTNNSAGEDGGPVWPNVEGLLPSYRTYGQDGTKLVSNVESLF